MIVGASPPMQEVFKRIALVAPSEACVHVRGESGTGKELVARAIHRYSRRAAGPFVAVNMASLSPTLAESELFGHVRGAFTGAEQSRKGLLEQAGGGTIFLDEVADIPMALQVKLLRVLEFGEIVPVGGEQAVRSDFRMISATHQDLQQRVAEGKFRHDLYFRLITFEIELPPLRQRRDDIGPLAEHFLDVLADRNPGPRPSLSPEALAELRRREWFGNVRELRNAIEHAMILARGGIIGREHLPPPLLPAGTPGREHAGQEEAIALLDPHLGPGPVGRPCRRPGPLRATAPPGRTAALEGRHATCRRTMPGRLPPPGTASHHAPQKARRTRHRRGRVGGWAGLLLFPALPSAHKRRACGFQIGFGILASFIQTQELQDEGFLEDVLRLGDQLAFLRQFADSILVAAEGQTLVKAAVELAFEFADGPILRRGFNFVKAPFVAVLHPEQEDVVRPTQREGARLSDRELASR